MKVKLISCSSVNSEQLIWEKMEILRSGNVGTYGNHKVKEHEITFYQGLLSSFFRRVSSLSEPVMVPALPFQLRKTITSVTKWRHW